MRKDRTVKTFLILLAISLGLLLLGRTKLVDNARGMIGGIFINPQESLYRFWQNRLEDFKFLVYWKSGQKKLVNLEQRNRELLVKAARVEALEKENKVLREQLNVLAEKKQEYILTKVVGRRDGLKINKGLNKGVKEKMVAVLGNYLVGKVVKAYPNFAVVQIPTDSSSKIEVMTLKNETKGILKGQFDRTLLLDSVLQKDQLTLEDEVVTSGEEAIFPEGLLIGKINKVMKKEADLFQKATVVPLLDFFSLKEVFIIKD